MKTKELMHTTVYRIEDDKLSDKTIFVIVWEDCIYICEEMDT